MFLFASNLTCRLSQYFGVLRKKKDKNLKYLLFIWLWMLPWQLHYKNVPLNCLFLKSCNLLKTIVSKSVLLEFNCQVCHSNFTIFYDSILFFGNNSLELMSVYFKFNTSFYYHLNVMQVVLHSLEALKVTMALGYYQKALDDN